MHNWQAFGLGRRRLGWTGELAVGGTSYISVEEARSDAMVVNIEAIQGSVIGPLLFLSLVNELATEL